MQRCIICSKPSGEEGFVGIKKGIAVSFCKKHARECNDTCDTCLLKEECPVCGEAYHPIENIGRDLHRKLKT